MYLKVEVYIPEKDHHEMMNALNEAGLLVQGNYDYVFSATKVVGHWRPLPGAAPTIGDKVEIVSIIKAAALNGCFYGDDYFPGTIRTGSLRSVMTPFSANTR